MKKDNQKYWFRAKYYGWGWGMPRTWQGWLSYLGGIGGFILCFIAGINFLEQQRWVGIGLLVLSFICLIIMLLICLQKGEPVARRWGGKK